MRFTSRTSHDGVTEQLFTLGELPGVLWTPDGAAGARPLILIGHGGGQHKKAPGVVSRAHRFVAESGYAVISVDAPNHGDRPADERFTRIANENRARMEAGEDVAPLIAALHAIAAEQTVPEWRAVVTAAQELDHVGTGPVGYWGVSMGCGLGVPFVAAEPRVRAAVFGLGGTLGLAEAAARVTVPLLFLLQWDDERIPRTQGLALFEAFASNAKTLHANPGRHGDLPGFETDNSLLFFGRHLGRAAAR